MLKPFFEIIGYAKLFKAYLGNRIYLIFCFSFLASMSEAFGIMMLLPLLESLGEQSQSLNIEESTSKINAILYQFFNFLGIANSTPSIIVLITIILNDATGTVSAKTWDRPNLFLIGRDFHV